jgi:aspartate/methionine/tyrosine aminotransferase
LAFDRTITITGFSKSYGLAGLRVGAVLAPNERFFREILSASGHESTIHGCNSPGQVAAAAALDECQDWLAAFLLHLRAMRDKTVGVLNSIPGISCHSPDGCYLAFPDIRKTGLTASELQEKLLNEAKVAVVPGLPRWFGDMAEGHIRICFATSDEILSEALHRIKNCLTP